MVCQINVCLRNLSLVYNIDELKQLPAIHQYITFCMSKLAK